MSTRPNTHTVIYLADDDEDDRMVFVDAVEDLGIPVRVYTSADGSQLMKLLHQAQQRLPEIIFLDINMPVKNGFECLEEIRSGNERFTDIKVIMLSTSSNPSNIQRCFELGADFYAVKPSTYPELKSLLTNVMAIDWSTFVRNKTKFLLW
ncbi:response regulator [Flavobacterium olei]|uniref:response regulator n=1 Tax=Flavobacterium olei TaxID=1886782 RepID=UPI00321AE61D